MFSVIDHAFPRNEHHHQTNLSLMRRQVTTTGAIALILIGLYIWAASATQQHLTLRVDGANATLSFDAEQRHFTIPNGLRYATFTRPAEIDREFQIDGSDNTNNFTLDRAYFDRFSHSPYYRFQSWLRDTSSFSRWGHVTVARADGHNEQMVDDPLLEPLAQLPSVYVLSATLSRLEAPVRLILSSEPGGAGNRLIIEINRNHHFVGVQQEGQAIAGTPEIKWYYPMSVAPIVAAHISTLGHVVMLSLILLASAYLLTLLFSSLYHFRTRRPQTFQESQPDRPPRAPAWILPVVVACWCPLIWTVSTIDFQLHPHIFDAASYYFQGHMFSLGRPWVPAPPLKGAFNGPFMVQAAGRWFSQYAPGAAMTLAPGFKLGMPWLVEPVLAAVTLVLLYMIGDCLRGRYLAALTALLCALSPFFLLQSASFMSHPICLFYLTGAYYACVRFLDHLQARYAFAAGLLVSAGFATRELGGILFGLPLAVFMLVSLYRRQEPWSVRIRAALPAVIGACIGLAGYLVYNGLITGNPLALPRLVGNPSDRLGFGENIGFYQRHTVAGGLENIDEMLTVLQFVLFGWPYYFSLAFLPLPFLLRRSTTWDWLNLGIVLSFLIGYVGYFYHGIALGPRYLYESLPALVLLTARGIEVMGYTVNSWAQSLLRRPVRVGWLSTHMLVGLLISANLIYFLPRQLDMYKNYSYLPDRPHLDFHNIYVPSVHHAIVVTTDARLFATTLFPLNSPFLDSDIVWAFETDGGTVANLRRLYPDRHVYSLEYTSTEEFMYMPIP